MGVPTMVYSEQREPLGRWPKGKARISQSSCKRRHGALASVATTEPLGAQRSFNSLELLLRVKPNEMA